jgi:threonine dehydrogenase-like Zn-dependent dehydrogenase
VLDVATEGPKPDAVTALGAEYHSTGIDAAIARAQPDIIVEATGASSLVFDAIGGTRPYGIVCLTGVSPVGRRISVDAGAFNREMVLENDAIVGSVNANVGHYTTAADSLTKADTEWLDRLITRRVRLERARDAFRAEAGDIKTVITLEA